MTDVITRSDPHTILPSNELREFIRLQTGVHLKAYRSVHGETCIGYEHRTIAMPYDSINISAAERYLEDDLAAATMCVRTFVSVPLTQYEFDALCSFICSVTPKRFIASRLLEILNVGGYAAIGQHMRGWCNIKSQFNRELNKRRIAENRLWNGEYN